MEQLELPLKTAIDPIELTNFMVKARSYDWNSSDHKIKIVNGRNQITFSEGQWRYIRIWIGEISVEGREAIFLGDTLAWELSYRGSLGLNHLSKLKEVKSLINQMTSFHKGFENTPKIRRTDQGLIFHNYLSPNNDRYKLYGEIKITYHRHCIFKLQYFGGIISQE